MIMRQCMGAAAWPLLGLFVLLPTGARAQDAGSRDLAAATFAGGCFWCVEEAFDQIEGVVRTTSGYTGGHAKDPTYEEVSASGTGHAEAVRVIYDPDRVSFRNLLHHFWRNIDPFVANRQFCDVGSSYRSAIFYHNEQQRRLAVATKERVAERFDMPVRTEITAASAFYPAEEYHQNYYKKNPLRYKFYKWSCGRADRLEEIWGDAAGGEAAESRQQKAGGPAGR